MQAENAGRLQVQGPTGLVPTGKAGQGQSPAKQLYGTNNCFCRHAEYTERLVLQQSRHSVLVSAWHKSTAQQVVVKSYAKTALKPRHLQNVYREIGLLSYLQEQGCKGVVTLLSAFEEESQIYLVFQACMRGDLYQLLMKEPTRQLTEYLVASSVALPLTMTLAELHELQIIHRDVKPENVFINTEGQIMLGDFGLAARLTDSLAERVGTLDYMAPEVLAMPTPSEVEAGRGQPAQPYNEKVDVWAVGCLCYELLSGKPPFEVQDPKETAALILAGKPEPFPERLSSACCDFIRTALTHNPKQRPSAVQLLQHPWISRYMSTQQQRKFSTQRSLKGARSSNGRSSSGVQPQREASTAADACASLQDNRTLKKVASGNCREEDQQQQPGHWMIGSALLTVHEQQQLRACEAAGRDGPSTPATQSQPALNPADAQMDALMVGQLEASGGTTPGEHSQLEAVLLPPTLSDISTSSGDSGCCLIDDGASPTGIRGYEARRASSGTSEFIAYHTPLCGTPALDTGSFFDGDDIGDMVGRCSSAVTLPSPGRDAALFRATSSCNGVLEGNASTSAADSGLQAWQIATPSTVCTKRAIGKSRFAR